MRVSRGAVMELMRAFCVLGLIFLNFAHVPVAAQSGAFDILTAASSADFCGDAPDGNAAHAPCHACRIGGAADLPRPCSLPVPITTVAGLVYGAMPVLLLPAQRLLPYGARAPPIA